MPRVPDFPLEFRPNCEVNLTNAQFPGTTTAEDQPAQVLRPYIAIDQDAIQGTALQLFKGGTLLLRIFIKTAHPIRRSPFVIQETNWTVCSFGGVNEYYIVDAFPWAHNDPLTNNNPIWYCVMSADQNFSL